MGKKKIKSRRKPGPKPETLKIEGDWQQAVKDAIAKGRPPKQPKE